MDKRHLIKKIIDDVMLNDEVTLSRWISTARYYLNKHPNIKVKYEPIDIVNDVSIKFYQDIYKWDEVNKPDFKIYFGSRIKGYVSNLAKKKDNQTFDVYELKENFSDDEGDLGIVLNYDHVEDNCNFESKFYSQYDNNNLLNIYSKNSNEGRLIDLIFKGYKRRDILKELGWTLDRYKYLMRKIREENKPKQKPNGGTTKNEKATGTNEEKSDPVKQKPRPNEFYN